MGRRELQGRSASQQGEDRQKTLRGRAARKVLRLLEYDPKKREPVFRKDHALPKCNSANRFDLKRLRSKSAPELPPARIIRIPWRLACQDSRAALGSFSDGAR